jgi:hypothetical protein
MLTCTAKFPTPPDPASTPATKQPVSQHFSASVDGVEVVPETEYDMSATAAASFDVAEGSTVELALFYRDASGLDSPGRLQTVTAPSAPDTIPPDAPGDFGEITFDPVAKDEVVTPPAPETTEEAKTTDAKTPPAPPKPGQ